MAIGSLAVLIAACGGGGSSTGSSGSTAAGNGAGESSGTPQAGGTVELSQGEEIITMNPLEGYVPEDVNVMMQIFETLWKENKEGEIDPWLIDSYKATDKDQLWTLQLKKGIKFSSGKPMTSADVKWSLEKEFENEPYASIMEGFETVEAPSPTTIVIKLKEPRPELPKIMTQWIFAVMPKDFGGVSEKQFTQHPEGTGPFKFAAWKKGESLTLEKNPNYWQQGKPYLEKVVFRTVQNPQSRVSQLRGGQLEAINAPPYQELESLEQGEFEVGEFGEGYAWTLVLNEQKPIFQNAKAREAVNISLNREAMIQAALMGRGTPAGSYLPPITKSWDESLKAPELDVEKAKQLVAEAVKEGVDPSFAIMVPAEFPFWNTAVQIAQQNLEEVGFDVTIKKVDTSSAI
ncbi:MAG: ABC transporter substrate-binding protein, partial [Actinobacteria bacterium]|nr:ABC transporter substrate-binding protein [Actinomycetota bacterium]